MPNTSPPPGRPLPSMAAFLSLIVLTASTWSLLTTARGADDRAQDRPSGEKVAVPVDKIEVDDGDTVTIDWSEEGREVVRILGIDTPEIQHINHNIPYDQAFGREASGFARGAFAVATQVEILRANRKDPYGRTLAYLFLNGRNYSELIIRARLATESVSRYGDNGFPEEAKRMIEAARDAGPMPFEDPADYRRRMREVSDWMRSQRTTQ